MEFHELPGGRLRILAPAKLNLYLEVGEARPDGFHEIDSIFQTISWWDRLDFQPTTDGEIHLDESGIEDGEANLVHRAAVLLGQEGLPIGSRAGVRITLEKTIPQGAGLGGGSSDAAATLVALARLWKIDLRRSELAGIGARLGSDVPFFIYGGTARCQGRGERVTPWHDIFDHAAPFHYVLASPRVHSATREIYVALDAERGNEFALTAPSPLDSMTSDDIFGRLIRGEVFFNRLEGVTRRLFPELEHVSSRMREEAFLAVLMTGSGSTFYGLSRSAGAAERCAKRLAARGPRYGGRGVPIDIDVRVESSIPSGSIPWLIE